MYHYLTLISLLVPADLRRGGDGGGGGGGTAERERLTRGLKRKGGGGVFLVRARAKKGKGRSFFFSFSLNTCKCDQFNLLSGSSRWRMAHGAGVCASDSAACVAAVFFDVFLQGFSLVPTEYAPYYM